MTRLTSKETPHGKYGYASYRIELDLSEPRRPMQRHIWTPESGEIEIGQWIPTISVSVERLLKDGWIAL